MGEIADQMINGGLCACCGAYEEWMDEQPGFPLYCSSECAPDHESWMMSTDYRNRKEQ